MSVTVRWTGDVGDTDPVWRYLLEKLGHVALFSWILVHHFPLSSTWTAVAVALLYTFGGKLLWLRASRARALAAGAATVSARFLDESSRPVELRKELRDTTFDLVLVLYVPLITLAPSALLFVLVALWGLTIGALFNNRWSSPGDVG